MIQQHIVVKLVDRVFVTRVSEWWSFMQRLRKHYAIVAAASVASGESVLLPSLLVSPSFQSNCSFPFDLLFAFCCALHPHGSLHHFMDLAVRALSAKWFCQISCTTDLSHVHSVGFDYLSFCLQLNYSSSGNPAVLILCLADFAGKCLMKHLVSD